MTKKAEATLWMLIELVAAFFIGYMAVDVAEAYAHNTIFEKLNIAKDLSMDINAVISVPGDVVLTEKNLHGYSVHFYENRIEVYENELEQAKGVYYYTKVGGKIDVKLNKPTEITISKINNDLKIS